MLFLTRPFVPFSAPLFLLLGKEKVRYNLYVTAAGRFILKRNATLICAVAFFYMYFIFIHLFILLYFFFRGCKGLGWVTTTKYGRMRKKKIGL